jgi:shikimate dehydrogenase
MGVPYAEVIGDPVEHSKSPVIHKFWLEQSGREGDYRRTRVTEESLAEYFRSRRQDSDWLGCNVTMPLKHAVVGHLDQVNEEVGRLGAVNCIKSNRRGGLYGTNFDAAAVLETLVPYPWSGRAVLLGNGGAARAALWALALLGFEEIVVISRAPDKALDMAGQLGIEVRVADWSEIPGCHLLVNATPLGMAGFPPLPVRLSAIPDEGAVFEMVYNPLVTPLVSEARRRGLRVFDGLTMLIEQAAMSFVTFFNRGIDHGQRAEVRKVLES